MHEREDEKDRKAYLYPICISLRYASAIFFYAEHRVTRYQILSIVKADSLQTNYDDLSPQTAMMLSSEPAASKHTSSNELQCALKADNIIQSRPPQMYHNNFLRRSAARRPNLAL